MGVIKKYEELGIYPDEHGILNIEISHDTTWLTRGHKSHSGMGFVAEIYIGFVLDMEVQSDFCLQCSRLKTKRNGKVNYQKYEKTKEQYKPRCALNFDSLSGSMEIETALRIWARSVDKNKMTYVVFVGDGDAKTFIALQEMNNNTGPYGIPVVKEECVNHLGKRLCTRLRKLKSDLHEVTATKTGRPMKNSLLGGKHKLTGFVIEKLTKYYTSAMRRNKGKTVKNVRKDIVTSYLHCTSIDERPNHGYCPKTEDPCCFYNKAVAKGETPKSHKEMNVLYFQVDGEARKEILNICLDLSKDDLLEKCQRCKTQNISEVLKSGIT